MLSIYKTLDTNIVRKQNFSSKRTIHFISFKYAVQNIDV